MGRPVTPTAPEGPIDLAIIGGTGLYNPDLLDQPQPYSIATPYGVAELTVGRRSGRRLAFLARHGAAHAVPPHRVNYRANLWALSQLGTRRVVATAASGSLRAALPPGTLCLPDQFLDFTHARPSTFFDGGEGGVVHTDMTEPYCPELRRLIAECAAERSLPCVNGGTYVCTEGPRFETPAEIRMFAQLGGDLVGMTGVPEVVLARELKLCYAAIGLCTNFAAGLAGRPLSHEEVLDLMDRHTDALRALLSGLAIRLPGERGCRCGA
jgi:5'-methylthioadenosine phosphorylase